MIIKSRNKFLKVIIRNLKEMENFAEDFLDNLCKPDKNKALIIALTGDLGSGKTTFLRYLGKALGIKERITSPTFVLMHEHDLSLNIQKKFHYSKFFHLDCYRVSEKDILNLGLKDLIADKKNIIAIEWADKIQKFLSKAIWLEFKVNSENEREIIIKN